MEHFDRYVIHPYHTKLMYWDGIMVCLLLWVAVCTPFEVTFLTNYHADWLWFWNRVLDFCFCW